MQKKKGVDTHKVSSEKSLEKKIAENLIALQKVNIDLAEKFDKLAKEISQLLALFETTARTFAKNAPIGEYEKDKEFLEKIDRLLDQNKTLAKGLTLMEERLRERMYGPEPKSFASKPEEEMVHSIRENESLPHF